LGVSIKFVQKHTQARRVPGQIKVGRLWRYKRSTVERALVRMNFLLPNK